MLLLSSFDLPLKIQAAVMQNLVSFIFISNDTKLMIYF